MKSWLVRSVLLASFAAPAFTQNDCATAVPISGLGSWAYDRTSAGASSFTSSGGGCSGTLQVVGEDVFFAWTAPAAGHYVVRIQDTGEAPSIRVYDSCSGFCNTGQEVSSYPGPTSAALDLLAVQAGETLIVRIGSSNLGVTPGSGVLAIEDRPAILPTSSCQNALPISGDVDVTWNNQWATTSGLGSTGGACIPINHFDPSLWDVFYQWTAVEDGTVVFDTAGSPANAVLQIYEGAGCSAQCFDRINGAETLILDDVVAGDTFLLQCGSSNSSEFDPATASGGVFRIFEFEYPANADCSAPTPIAGSGPWSFSTLGLGSSGFDGGSFSCQPALGPYVCVQRLVTFCYYDGNAPIDRDQFFVWTAPCNGPFEIWSQGNPQYAMASVYAGTDCSATCLGSSVVSPVQSLSFGATAGDQFLIQIGGNTTLGSQDIAGTFEIRRTAGPCSDGLSIACDPPQTHYLGGSVSLADSAWEGAGSSGLHVEATGGPPNEFGFFLIGASANSSLSVFNGTLCLDAPLGRYNSQIADNQGLPQLNSVGLFDNAGVLQNLAGTSASGSGFDVPAELPYSPVGQVIAPGDTWAIQLWYRDQTGIPGPLGSTANFSNVLLATFP